MNTATDPKVPTVSILDEMLNESKAIQSGFGYADTLAEICQQPDTWVRTAKDMDARCAELKASVDGCQAIVLTGSGSSQFAAPFSLAAVCDARKWRHSRLRMSCNATVAGVSLSHRKARPRAHRADAGVGEGRDRRVDPSFRPRPGTRVPPSRSRRHRRGRAPRREGRLADAPALRGRGWRPRHRSP